MLRSLPDSDLGPRNGIELLENRIAPATVLAVAESNTLRFDHFTLSVIDGETPVTGLYAGELLVTQTFEPVVSKNGRSVRFTDVDGDLVKVTVSKGKLDPWRVVLSPTEHPGRFEFQQLDLSTESGKKFNKANVTIKAVRQDLDGDGSKEGDGLVNLGQLQATGVNLGKVKVDGNLGGIFAGDTSVWNAKHKLSMKSLQVLNFGQPDLFSSDLGSISESVIQGNAGKIGIKQDLAGVSLEVTGSLGTLMIGGSIVGGAEQWSGQFVGRRDVDKIRLGGSVLGGSGADSGMLVANGLVNSLKIGGAIEGGSGENSGSVNLGTLVKGHVEQGMHGGNGHYSGMLKARTIIKLAIDDVVQGGGGNLSGSIQVGYRGHAVIAGILSLEISGGLLTGPGEESGSVIANGSIEAIRVIGSVTGEILAERGTLDNVMITGDVAGTAARPARLSGLFIGTVTVEGSVSFGEITTPLRMTKLSIGGSLYASSVIATEGTISKTGEEAIAIGEVTIGGNMEKSQILAGYDPQTQRNDGNSGIGAVVIQGDLIASDIVAGVYSRNKYYGDYDDRVLEFYTSPPVIARIASVKVLGQVYGTEVAGDSFGIVAEQIDSVEIGQSVLRPAPGEWFTLSATRDVVVREV